MKLLFINSFTTQICATQLCTISHAIIAMTELDGADDTDGAKFTISIKIWDTSLTLTSLGMRLGRQLKKKLVIRLLREMN